LRLFFFEETKRERERGDSENKKRERQDLWARRKQIMQLERERGGVGESLSFSFFASLSIMFVVLLGFYLYNIE
jgi:hypothetical protein